MSSDSRVLLLKKANLIRGDLDQAMLQLDEALRREKDDFVCDAAIQRFEFCFELAWKAIQAVCRLEGIECASPRMAFSIAWRQGWISEEGAWLDMLDDRNKTSHTYRESMALEVFAALPRHLPHLRLLHQHLVTRVRRIEFETLNPPADSAT
jgi:nucleotidyltransferase substrate binding protein (TIGR01987 family)